MKKNNIVIVLIVITLLSLSFFAKPYFRRREAINVVNSVLKHWKNGDLTLAMSYWENKEESPPIYDLIAYKVGKGDVYKKDHVYSAHIIAVLDFPPNNPLPSKKEWVFKLNKTRYGWKITDFRLRQGGRP